MRSASLSMPWATALRTSLHQRALHRAEHVGVEPDVPPIPSKATRLPKRHRSVARRALEGIEDGARGDQAQPLGRVAQLVDLAIGLIESAHELCAARWPKLAELIGHRSLLGRAAPFRSRQRIAPRAALRVGELSRSLRRFGARRRNGLLLRRCRRPRRRAPRHRRVGCGGLDQAASARHLCSCGLRPCHSRRRGATCTTGGATGMTGAGARAAIRAVTASSSSSTRDVAAHSQAPMDRGRGRARPRSRARARRSRAA